jgi:hypothetical protein
MLHIAKILQPPLGLDSKWGSDCRSGMHLSVMEQLYLILCDLLTAPKREGGLGADDYRRKATLTITLTLTLTTKSSDLNPNPDPDPDPNPNPNPSPSPNPNPNPN